MNSEELNNAPASDEVAAAEAELRAAQETLEAAKARLAELKNEHPAVEPGASEGEDGSVCTDGVVAEATFAVESFEVAAVVVDEDTTEVEAAVLEAEVSSAASDAEAFEASGSFDASETAETFDASAVSETTEASDVVPSVPGAASSAEPLPDWVPYSTTPTVEPASGAQAVPFATPQAAPEDAARATSSAPGPIPPPPGTPASYPEGANTGASWPNGTSQQYQPQQPYAGYAAPGYGQTPHAGPGAVPPQQQYYSYQQPYYQQPYQQPIATKDHVAAGLLAIFLGCLGIHKFYLGYNTAGFIMLAVTIIGSIFTLGLAGGVIWVISIIEGILYLTKSQSEFEQIYVVNKREWF